MTTTRICLIRHGVTASNRERRYMGRSEEGLSADGRWQARQLSLRTADLPLAAIYASPLRRAKETAEIIAQPHALRVTAAPAFTELDLQRWEGLTAAEIRTRDPGEWSLWCSAPQRLRTEGVEALDDLSQRVRRGLEGVLRQHADESIAIVTHDGVVRAAVLAALGIGIEHYRAIPVDNTGLTVLETTPERTYLRALNDTGHLGEAVPAVVAGPADR